MAKLQALIEMLCHHRPLEPRHKDHPLAGEWEGYRDCHVEPDWLMIYPRGGLEHIVIRRGRELKYSAGIHLADVTRQPVSLRPGRS